MEDFAWSTHQPLIQLCLKLNPEFILELGIGNYSTPFFLKYECDKMFIENDLDWINKMNIPAIHHKINIPNQDIPVHNISIEQKRDIFNYYYELKESLYIKPTPRLLFVDNFSCCRSLAINTLFPAFDYIIFHDCEPQSIDRNNYYFHETLIKEYDLYHLQTPRTWAGLFIKKKLGYTYQTLTMLINPFIENYKTTTNVNEIYFK